MTFLITRSSIWALFQFISFSGCNSLGSKISSGIFSGSLIIWSIAGCIGGLSKLNDLVSLGIMRSHLATPHDWHIAEIAWESTTSTSPTFRNFWTKKSIFFFVLRNSVSSSSSLFGILLRKSASKWLAPFLYRISRSNIDILANQRWLVASNWADFNT